MSIRTISNVGSKFRWAAIVLLTSSQILLWAQSEQPNQIQEPQASNPTLSRAADGNGYMLHVTTREIVVEVVARDRKNRPVDDLKQSEFEVIEDPHKSRGERESVSAFRIIDPNSEKVQPDDRMRSAVLPIGGRCEIRTTVHYELAFHPTSWTSGFHSVLITTSRQHVTLSYRAQFYVGVSDNTRFAAHRESKEVNADLLRAACYHSGVPASLSLSAKKIENPDATELHYSVKILPGSLELAGTTPDSKNASLEYGVCTFSKSGRVMDFWHFAGSRPLSAATMGSVLADGWSESVVVPTRGRPAMARFVALEPGSGNLGSIAVSTDARIPSDEPEEGFDHKEPNHILVASDVPTGIRGRSGSLGSLVAKPGALCGDVYELPVTTSFLPDDFRALNAVGAVYVNSFNVSEQILSQGIPGSTPRSEWFGIDYYGQFWVAKPGKYQFVLNADDGADLYIDDRRLISDDGIHPPRTVDGSVTLEMGMHSIHLPYFQGPTYVNLILQIKPPGEELKIFNIRDFANPAKAAK